MPKIPSDDILGSLYKLRIRESAQLKTVLELYDMEIHEKISVPDYQKLKTMVERRKDQELRLRNFDARHGKIETGAMIKKRKGFKWRWRRKRHLLPVERKRPMFEGKPVQFLAWENDHAPKPTPFAATPSEPSLTRGRSASRKRSIRGKSNSSALFDNRAVIICKRSPCDYWHPPELSILSKMKQIAKPMISASFPHHKVDEQTEQKAEEERPFTQKKRRRRQISNEFCEDRGVVSRKTRSYWILKEADRPGENRCKESWDRFEEYDSLSLRNVKQVSGKRKGLRLEKC